MRPEAFTPSRRVPGRLWLGDVGLYAILTVAAIPFVFPVIWMISSSLKPELGAAFSLLMLFVGPNASAQRRAERAARGPSAGALC